MTDPLAGLGRRLAEREAVASAALDGETRSVPSPGGGRGFGCPGCGAPLEERSSSDLVLGLLSCCGASIDGATAARVLVGRRLR